MFVCTQLAVNGIPLDQSNKRLLLNDQDFMDSRFRKMEEQIMNLTKEVQTLKSREHIRNSVAFVAVLDHNLKLAPQQIVRFNDVFNNQGNAYDSSTGIFECPFSGVYGVSLGGMGDVPIHLRLMLNGNELVRVWTHGSGVHELASQTVFAHLNQHDRLWVESTDTSTLYGAEKYNVFSAALITADN